MSEESPANDRFDQLIALGVIVLFFIGVIEGIKSLPQLVESDISMSPISLAITLHYFALVAIIIGSVIGLFSFLRVQKPSIQTIAPFSKANEQIKEFRKIIDKAVYSLDQGMDYRSTIIQCYKAVLSLLERSGIPPRDSLTPREFEAEVGERIRISSEYLHAVTSLFERARYSKEELSSNEAARAQYYLEKLSLELSREESDSMSLETKPIER